MTTPYSGRLSENIRPSRYDLSLNVDPQTRKFSGTVSIHIAVTEPTRSIILHALDLRIAKAVLAGNDGKLDARITFDPDSETVAMAFDRDLSPGPARLDIGFSGLIGSQLRGLYGVEVEGEVFAFTQLEATDARRMFPCFDEPAFKARFRLTVTIPADLMALSNMPEKETRTEGNLKTVTFDETPLMSTYLLALSVARLESREIQVGPTRIGIWTLPGQTHLTEFALKTTAAVLPLLNDYFDLPYPYPKLDLVSVPDFAMGAMENWGAIFFRDSCLLLDEDQASATSQRSVANVITHEIVHQWFGNLVTMEWWDDLWLNESFATWLACKIVDQWRPEWNSWTEFQQEKQVPLALDSLNQTRPIHAPVHRSSEIEEMFDALTYEKGAACLRMMEQFLGPDIFRKGIRDYIRKHQFKNARADHLWEELDRATGQPVSQMARDWFTQPGYPLLTITQESPEPGTFNLRQNRFLSLPSKDPESDSLWTLPYTLRWKDQTGIHAHQGILVERSSEIRLPVKEKLLWIHGNTGERGFFRSAYPEDLRKRLRPALTGEMEDSEVIGYLNHAWALCQTSEIPLAEFMETLRLFEGTSSRFVIQALLEYLNIISHQLVRSDDRLAFETFTSRLFRPVWTRLGWDPKPGEGDEERLSRAAALWAMGALAQDEDILSELPRLLMRHWTDSTVMDPTLLGTFLRLCIRTDGGSLFERFVQKIQSATTPEDRDRFLIALAEYKKPSIARKVLEYSLSPEVRSQDAWRPIRYMEGNIAVQESTWSFIKDHWDEIRKKTGTVGTQRIIQGLRSFWKTEWRTGVEEFYQRSENHIPSAKRALAQTLEFMDIGIRFREKQSENLSQWFKTVPEK